MSEPLVSVIVPAYNAARWIDETLRSVASQTHRNLDVIIVDDGSTDDTARLAQIFVDRDPRFRLVRQENAGVAAARNHGARLARSDLLSFVDADDLWSVDKTADQQRTLLAAGPGVGLCYSWYVMIDAESRIFYREPGRVIEGHVLDKLMVDNFIGNGSAALVRREAFDAARGFEPALRNANAQGCEDILFYARVAEHYAFVVAQDHHIGYRQLPDNMSSDLNRMLRSWLMFVDEMAGRHPDKRRLLAQGLRRYARWLTRRAVHRRRPATLLSVAMRVAVRNPKLAARLLLIEAPGAVREQLAWQRQQQAAADASGIALADRFTPGQRYPIG